MAKIDMAQLISIDDLSKRQQTASQKFALFELGFRPFFLLGSLFAFLAITPWILSLHGIFPNQNLAANYTLWWHGHEMIFGFALAIIMGFLLTAAQNWTGVPSIKGKWLSVLVGLWLLPRLGLALSAQPFYWLWAVCDVLANIGILLVLARMILKAKQWRNSPFLLIMSTFAILNLLSYGFNETTQSEVIRQIHYAAIWLIAIVVNIMGGRVIPAFTQNAVKYGRQPESPWLLRLTSLGLVLLMINSFLDIPIFLRIVAAITGALLLYRWHFWGWYASWRNPLLWSLHISFVCLPLACLLIAAGYPFTGALHLLTIGAISGLIIAMMSRVSLGHTGRMLQAPRGMKFAYVLIILSAMFRTLAAVWVQWYLPLIDVAVLCWLFAFLGFLYYYTPILLTPRVDGKRG